MPVHPTTPPYPNLPITKYQQSCAAYVRHSGEKFHRGLIVDYAFIADEGLQKPKQAMTMIPTYVTAVPNGTEKVTRNLGALTTRLAASADDPLI